MIKAAHRTRRRSQNDHHRNWHGYTISWISAPREPSSVIQNVKNEASRLVAGFGVFASVIVAEVVIYEQTRSSRKQLVPRAGHDTYNPSEELDQGQLHCITFVASGETVTIEARHVRTAFADPRLSSTANWHSQRKYPDFSECTNFIV